MIERIQKLESDFQDIKEKHKTVTRDIACILKTWDDFTEAYLPYLKLLAEREKDRAELRRAVIKHGTIIALGALIVFMFSAISHEIAAIIKAMPR